VRQYNNLQNEITAMKAKDGAIESVVLPNFKIPVRAVFDEAEEFEKTLTS